MKKVIWKPTTVMGPLPAVFVGCGTLEQPNLITVAWTGIVCTTPAMTYVSIRPSRYSHRLIQESGEFTINLASADMVRKLDSCGVYTGAKMNKFERFSLTPSLCQTVKAPGVDESPITLECKVERQLSLGSHDMFLARICAVDVCEDLIDEKGKLCLNRAHLITYSHGDYLSLGKKLGSFGFSVKKKQKNTKQRGKI